MVSAKLSRNMDQAWCLVIRARDTVRAIHVPTQTSSTVAIREGESISCSRMAMFRILAAAWTTKFISPYPPAPAATWWVETTNYR